MKRRICICCGEEISERGNVLSRNPNLCASCSSLADGMDDGEIRRPKAEVLADGHQAESGLRT
jgi:hypothetical protein